MKINYLELKMNKSILKLSIILSVFLIISACGSDDNGDSEPQNTANLETDILGTWNLIEHSASRTIAETGTTIIENGSDYNYTIVITDNPKFINTNGSYNVNVDETNSQNQTSSFNYIVNSNENQQEGFHIGEWSISNGNLITRVFDDEPNGPGSYQQTSEIVELTENRLVLKTDDSASSSENYTVTGNTTLVYER